MESNCAGLILHRQKPPLARRSLVYYCSGVHTGDESNALEPLEVLLGTYFYKPDFQAIRIVLGAIQSHYLNLGDPAWLFVVAPPGTGKTTMGIMGAAGLREVVSLSDFTESTFLSGFHGHQQPGLLEKLGHTQSVGNVHTTTGNAIFLAKDFTTVLTMRREKRGVILGQLREIHDGEFKRDFGTGVSKIWRGRVTIIAAVTPVLDRHYSIFSTLGERFQRRSSQRSIPVTRPPTPSRLSSCAVGSRIVTPEKLSHSVWSHRPCPGILRTKKAETMNQIYDVLVLCGWFAAFIYWLGSFRAMVLDLWRNRGGFSGGGGFAAGGGCVEAAAVVVAANVAVGAESLSFWS